VISTKVPSHADRIEAERLEVVVIGAGFAGVGIAIQMKRRGRASFVVLERAGDVGGTWRDNRYPGVACDIPSQLYSLSFRPDFAWSRLYAQGSEIQAYLRECAREEGILPHIRLGEDALRIEWCESTKDWEVRTQSALYVARSVVIATGRLSTPKLPAAEDIAGFSRPLFHSSQWDETVELAGRRVGIAGTGASAIQLIPELAKLASKLVVFQRTAAWILPKNDRAYTDDEVEFFATDAHARSDAREAYFWSAEEGFRARAGDRAAIAAVERLAKHHRDSGVSDDTLRAALTPDYEVGCKRILLSDEFYPTMSQSNVTLESSAVRNAQGNTVTAASGQEHTLDVMIFATGFDSTHPSIAHRIVGIDGELLATHWQFGMTAYASTVVHGFPNLFIIDGPNASLGHNSAIYMIETQIEYTLGALEFLDKNDGAQLEVTASAEEDYTREIDRMAANTVWLQGGCTSWYVDERSRRVTLLWPDFAHAFRRVNGRFSPGPFEQRSSERRTEAVLTGVAFSDLPGN